MNYNSVARTTIAKQIEVYHTYRSVVDEAVVVASVTLLTVVVVELDGEGDNGT
jgi:hypothetical protein